ncbi:MAG TPA: bifunctional oligoribonuclease/PAP phosphatase NrnA [Bacillota bacterium]|nr:bifunctional oligoribonuclease/PAP phosphatase NrnA [Bacillota bacterium]
MGVSSVDQIITLFEKGDRFMLGCHEHPDGDAIGSVLALGLSLKARGKNLRMVVPEGVPTVYRYLEGSHLIVDKPEEGFVPAIVVALDCADRARLSLPDWPVNATVVNIDHHITNSGFGHVSLVEPHAAATGEIVADLLAEGGFPFDSTIASALYTALATDTGFFRYANTTGKTMRLASDWVDTYGVSPSQIAEQVHEEKSFASLKLLAEVLSTLTLEEEGKVSWMLLSYDMLERYQVPLEETESFVNYANSVHGVEVGILFKELQPNEFKMSFRSGASVDVSKLAAEFGGGGHARAAGCSLNGTFEECRKKLFEAIHRALR